MNSVPVSCWPLVIDLKGHQIKLMFSTIVDVMAMGAVAAQEVLHKYFGFSIFRPGQMKASRQRCLCSKGHWVWGKLYGHICTLQRVTRRLESPIVH